MLLIATIIRQQENEPSTFTARYQSHKSGLIAVPQWNKLAATFRSALMQDSIPLIPQTAICTLINYCCISPNYSWKVHLPLVWITGGV